MFIKIYKLDYFAGILLFAKLNQVTANCYNSSDNLRRNIFFKSFNPIILPSINYWLKLIL